MNNDRFKFRQWLGNEFHYWGIGLDDCSFVGPASGGGTRADNTPHQQWTGLYDSEGVEIYSDDIVTVECDNYRVIYSDRYACFQLAAANSLEFYLVKCFSNPFKVAGNIYQNPELLENSSG